MICRAIYPDVPQHPTDGPFPGPQIEVDNIPKCSREFRAAVLLSVAPYSLHRIKSE